MWLSSNLTGQILLEWYVSLVEGEGRESPSERNRKLRHVTTPQGRLLGTNLIYDLSHLTFPPCVHITKRVQIRSKSIGFDTL